MNGLTGLHRMIDQETVDNAFNEIMLEQLYNADIRDAHLMSLGLEYSTIIRGKDDMAKQYEKYKDWKPFAPKPPLRPDQLQDVKGYSGPSYNKIDSDDSLTVIKAKRLAQKEINIGEKQPKFSEGASLRQVMDFRMKHPEFNEESLDTYMDIDSLMMEAEDIDAGGKAADEDPDVKKMMKDMSSKSGNAVKDFAKGTQDKAMKAATKFSPSNKEDDIDGKDDITEGMDFYNILEDLSPANWHKPSPVKDEKEANELDDEDIEDSLDKTDMASEKEAVDFWNATKDANSYLGATLLAKEEAAIEHIL